MEVHERFFLHRVDIQSGAAAVGRADYFSMLILTNETIPPLFFVQNAVSRAMTTGNSHGGDRKFKKGIGIWNCAIIRSSTKEGDSLKIPSVLQIRPLQTNFPLQSAPLGTPFFIEFMLIILILPRNLPKFIKIFLIFAKNPIFRLTFCAKEGRIRNKVTCLEKKMKIPVDVFERTGQVQHYDPLG